MSKARFKIGISTALDNCGRSIRWLAQFPFFLWVFNSIYAALPYSGKQWCHLQYATIFRGSSRVVGKRDWAVRFRGKRVVIRLTGAQSWLEWDIALSILGHDVDVIKTYEILLRVLEKPVVFFDVGANYGLHSLLMRVQGARVFSFEPNPECAEFFLQCCRHNNISCESHHCAFGESEGSAELCFPHRQPWLGTVVESVKKNISREPDLRCITVRLRTIDNFVKEAGAYPSLIKIDTEGSDLSVLRGAVQTIAAHRPVVVFESFPDKERSHYWSFLKSMHYDIASLPYSLSDHSFIKEEDFCADKKANFIALPDGFLAPPIERVSGTRMIVSVTGLARTIWHEHYAPIIGTAQVEYMLEKFQSEKAIAAQIERESYRYFLLSEGVRGWIGYAAVIVQKDALFLSKLYILAGYRGRGHGARAIGFFEAMARKKKLLRICLTVNKRNAASIKAYEKLGFVISDSVVMDIGNGFVMDDYRMHKVLAP